MQSFSKFDTKTTQNFLNWHGCGRIPNGLRKNPEIYTKWIYLCVHVTDSAKLVRPSAMADKLRVGPTILYRKSVRRSDNYFDPRIRKYSVLIAVLSAVINFSRAPCVLYA